MEHSKIWRKQETDVYGQYLSFSYGISQKIELTIGGMGGYQTQDTSVSFMNPLLQLKAKVFDGENFTPSVAIDFGYVYKSGLGEYFDPATNYYAITASTISLQNLQIHANFGVKSSHDIPFGSVTRPMLELLLIFHHSKVKKFTSFLKDTMVHQIHHEIQADISSLIKLGQNL